MTDTELNELEILARAATPGPWSYFKNKYNEHHVSLPAQRRGDFNLALFRGGCPSGKEDAEYVAAANPNTILNLIADLKQTQVERDWLAEKCESMAHALDPCEFYPSYYWKDQAKTYAKEIACQKN